MTTSLDLQDLSNYGNTKNLPRDTELEKMVLGILLEDGRRIYEVKERLCPHHFYSTNHVLIYEGILHVFSQGTVPDSILVGNYLQSKGKLDEIGGFPYLIRLWASLGEAPSKLLHYSLLLIELWLARQSAIRAMEYYNSIVGRKFDDIFDALQHHQKQMQELTSSIAVNKDRSMVGIGIRALKELDRIMYEGFQGIQTGVDHLRNTIHSLKNGRLIGILARSRTGKSAFAAAIMASITRSFYEPYALENKELITSTYRVGLISLEMNDTEVYWRLVSEQCNYMGHHIPYFNIENGLINDDQRAVINQAVVELTHRGIFIDDEPCHSDKELEMRIRMMVEIYKVQAIFLDYVQLVEESDAKNKAEFLARLANKAKNLAKQLQIPIIILIQAGRDSEKGTPRSPVLSDIQWSDGIGQALDVLITLYRPDLYEENPIDEDGDSLRGCLVIGIDKHRGGKSGPTMKKAVGFDNATNSFTEKSMIPVPLAQRHLQKAPFQVVPLF